MNSIYRPCLFYKSIYDIDYKLLKEKGICYLLFDLDNTLALVNEKNASKELIRFFKKLKNDFNIILFSNALKGRVKRFSDDLDIDYEYLCFKPRKFKYKKLLSSNIGVDSICAIGDQLCTDIKGANKMGIYSILVKPLSKKESIFTKLNRLREKKMYKEFNINF